MAATRNALDERQQFDALDLMGGDMNDREIADRFGVSPQTIGRLRRKHGVAPVPNRMHFRPTDAQLAELRVCSNREMERRYRVTCETWGRVRKRFGIPRFRQPTVIDGKPVKWVVKEKINGNKAMFFEQLKPSPIPPRDTSIAGEAASYLRRERWHCFERWKIGMGAGWQVGTRVMNEIDMIAFAKKKGFRQEEWMA